MNYFAQEYTNLCTKKCMDNTYGYNGISPADYSLSIGAFCETTANACYLHNQYFADDSTNLCVPICPSTQGTFGDPVISKKCVLKCPISSNVIYYADPDTRICISNCLPPYFG